MKKLSAMVMAGVMALGMVGCGSTAAEAPAESTAPAAESTAAETTETTNNPAMIYLSFIIILRLPILHMR